MLTLDLLTQAAVRAGFRKHVDGHMRRSFSRKGGANRTRVQLIIRSWGILDHFEGHFVFLNNRAYARTLSITRGITMLESQDLLQFQAFLEQVEGI
jgi:hypothetical protein